MTEHGTAEISKFVSVEIGDFDPKYIITAFPDWTWEEKIFVQVFFQDKKKPKKVESGWLFQTDIGLIRLVKEPAGALIMARKSEFLVKDIQQIYIDSNGYCSTIIFEGKQRQLIYERFKDSNNVRIHINNINQEGKIEYSDIVSL